VLLGLLAWTICSLTLGLTVYLLFPLFRTKRISLDLSIFLFLLIFFATAYSLLFGLLGYLRPLPMTVGCLIGLVLFALVKPTRVRLLMLPSRLRLGSQIAADGWLELPPWQRWLTLGFAAVVALRFAFLIWALPPFIWDSLTYHLTNVAEWIQRGRIELFETSVVRIHNPANYEILTTWFAVFIRHDVVVEMAGIPAYLLACVSLFAICRSAGSSRPASHMAMLAYASTPALLLATTGTKNDVHMAAYYLAALAIILNLVSERKPLKAENILGQVWVLIIMLFYALGTKAYILHLLPGLLLTAMLARRASMRDRIRRWRSLLKKGLDQIVDLHSTLLGLLVLLLALGLFLGLYWNIRNWALTGNPFYPYGVEVETEKVFEGAGKVIPLRFSRLVQNLKSLAGKFGDRAALISADLPETTGWGWVSYGLGLVALAWGLIRRRSIRMLAAGFSLSFLVLYMSTRPSPWNMRYAIWFPALFAVSLAALYDWMSAKSPRLHRVMLYLLMFSLGANVIVTLNYGRVPLDQFQRMLELPTLERDAARLHVTVPNQYETALKIVPEEDLLGYNVHDNGFIYPLYRADFSQHLVFVPLAEVDNCADVRRVMDQADTEWLFIWRADYEKASILLSCSEVGVLDHVREGLYALEEE
jgi:hypothetical protein